MADENKKAVIKSELDEVKERVETLLYEEGVFKKFRINETLYIYNITGNSIDGIFLDMDGEFVDYLDDNIYFNGNLKVRTTIDGVPGGGLISLISSANFMTDVSNTGTTAVTTTGIQTTLNARWREVDTTNKYFGGRCMSPGKGVTGLFDTPIEIFVFYHIANDRIIFKGCFINFIAGYSSVAAGLLETYGYFEIPNVRIPLFKFNTITYNQ